MLAPASCSEVCNFIKPARELAATAAPLRNPRNPDQTWILLALKGSTLKGASYCIAPDNNTTAIFSRRLNVPRTVVVHTMTTGSIAAPVKAREKTNRHSRRGGTAVSYSAKSTLQLRASLAIEPSPKRRKTRRQCTHDIENLAGGRKHLNKPVSAGSRRFRRGSCRWGNSTRSSREPS